MIQKAIVAIEWLVEATGKAVALLLPCMAAVTFLVVVLLYFFDWGRIWLQESVTYMHGFVMMTAIAYTLKHDKHVRVGFIYENLSPRKRAWINILGCALLLLPMCALFTWEFWPYVARSWSIREGGVETGGIQGIFILKGFMLVFCVLLFLMGVAVLLRNALFLMGKQVPPLEVDE